MMGGSLKLHKDNMKSYAEVLMGTCVAVIFVTLYCTVSLYNMIPVSIASIFGILLVIMTWFIAEKYKWFSTFLIGFAGGYLNPFLTFFTMTIFCLIKNDTVNVSYPLTLWALYVSLIDLFGIASGAVFTLSIIVLLFNSFDFSSTRLLPVLNLRFIAYMFAIGACVYYSTKSKIYVLKITLFDMAQLEMQYKIITYITLGIILMAVSFFYNRLKGSDS